MFSLGELGKLQGKFPVKTILPTFQFLVLANEILNRS